MRATRRDDLHIVILHRHAQHWASLFGREPFQQRFIRGTTQSVVNRVRALVHGSDGSADCVVRDRGTAKLEVENVVDRRDGQSDADMRQHPARKHRSMQRQARPQHRGEHGVDRYDRERDRQSCDRPARESRPPFGHAALVEPRTHDNAGHEADRESRGARDEPVEGALGQRHGTGRSERTDDRDGQKHRHESDPEARIACEPLQFAKRQLHRRDDREIVRVVHGERFALVRHALQPLRQANRQARKRWTCNRFSTRAGSSRST